MKKKLFLAGMAALLCALGLVVVGCDNGTDSGGGGGDAITSDPPKSTLYSVAGSVETPESAAGTTLKSNLEWLDDYATTNGVYAIKVSASGSIGDIELMKGRLNNATGVSITLTTAGTAEMIIALNANGRLFTVGDWGGGDNITLTLGGSITLRGLSSNVSELVRVQRGSTLNLTGNAKITGNNGGGGVRAENGGIITMSGGKISGNNGGGVNLRNTGSTLTMSGGEISGNTAGNGGGVNLEDNATFTMSGGTISGNNGAWTGGGVSVQDSGTTFTMSGGTISGNTAHEGGGVQVQYSASFTMSNTAVINGNTAKNGERGGSGGGVSMRAATFTMSGGTVSGNTSFGYGGGVCIGSDAGSSFTKTGGIIYGDIDGSHTPGANENTTVNRTGAGHAVFLYASSPHWLKNTDATGNMSWDDTNAVGFDSTTNAG